MAERNLNFDEVIERHNTLSLKYDFAERRGRPADVLPLWVADMDFKTSSYIQDALNNVVQHGIFGYSETQTPYYETIRNRIKTKFGYDFAEEHLVKTPGIVFAVAMAIKAFTNEGDGVLIQQPVYYCFNEAIRDNRRVIVDNTLYLGDDNRYHIDFEDFERKIVDNHIKLFILCNPHNPCARNWTEDELIKLGDICLRHNVLVLSDEIHADFTFVGRHIVFASLRPEYEDITITCTSATKTYNLASVQLSNIIIKNPDLRARFQKEIDAAGYSQCNIFGIVATEAAYKYGDEWLEAMLKYVEENVRYVKDYIAQKLPKVRMIEHEATYLVWLDFGAYGLKPRELDDIIINRAKLWLDSGRIFGQPGYGFQRINVACPRSILTECLERIRKSFEDLG